MSHRWEFSNYNIGLFNNATRPALVQYSLIRENFIKDDIYFDVRGQINIDGSVIPAKENFRAEVIPRDEIHIFHPASWTENSYNSTLNRNVTRTVVGVESEPFQANKESDWHCLFYEFDYFSQNNDVTITGIVAKALMLYPLYPNIVTGAIMKFQGQSRNRILDCLESIAYSLSPEKCQIIKQILHGFNKQSIAFFPDDLAAAAQNFSIHIGQDDTVYSVFDNIWEIKNNYGDNIIPNNPISIVLLWYLNGGEIDLGYVARAFAFAGEQVRALLIKHYFHSVSQKKANYSSVVPKALLGADYQYYSLYRHYLTDWPGKMDVTTEFILECIETYKQTNQQRFQVTNGLLDRMVQRSTESRIPLSVNYRTWLYTCQGGVMLDPEFTGFISIFITYEIDELAFEEDSLKKNINTLIRRHCHGIYRTVSEPEIDPETGLQRLDTKTQQPKFSDRKVFDNKWELNHKHDWTYIHLFVNEGRRPENLPENQFCMEMIDLDIVREQIRLYLMECYVNERPEIEYSKTDEIISMFMFPVKMRAQFREDCSIGANPGTDEAIIYKHLRECAENCFGASLECDFDHSKLSDITRNTLYGFGDHKECFVVRPNSKGKYKVFCYPNLSENEHFLTGKKFAICNGATCFKTSIRRDIRIEEYKLINLLEIVGYRVLDETEAGLFPNATYRQFMGQISKAVNFYKRLTCRSCGHVLFPVQQKQNQLNEFNRFKCIHPTCSECNKEIYLNYCFKCKKGLIDSRDTHQCSNGLYICPNPDCNACCSNEMFEKRAKKYQNNGKPIPVSLQRMMGKGHWDLGLKFCARCGAQKIDNLCPRCDMPELSSNSAANALQDGLPVYHYDVALETDFQEKETFHVCATSAEDAKNLIASMVAGGNIGLKGRCKSLELMQK